MRGHGVLRDRQRTGDVARGKPVRPVLHQQAEYIQPGRLGQRGKSENDLLSFHISRITDISFAVKQNRQPQPSNPYFDIARNTVDGDNCARHHVGMRLDDAAAQLEALGNPTRLKIYRTLIRAGAAGLPVGRLQERLKIAASTLSHHIKALVVAGLVTQVREATTLVCHANYDVMRELVDFLVAECCADASDNKGTKTAA
jgi:DNA-binding transcriptional ArsR family regulator